MWEAKWIKQGGRSSLISGLQLLLNLNHETVNKVSPVSMLTASTFSPLFHGYEIILSLVWLSLLWRLLWRINRSSSCLLAVCHYKIFHTWWPLSISYSKIHECLAWGASNDPCVNTLKAPSYKGTGRWKTYFRHSVFNLSISGSAWQASFAK